MSIKVRVLQHKKKDLKGKWYGRVVKTGEVGLQELSENISESCTLTEADVYAVVKALVAEMKTQLQSGKTVVLDDFGRFHLTIKSDLVDKEEDYNLKRHVKRVLCKFTPAGHRDQLDRHLVHPFIDGTEVERFK
ncbi:MAG: HU family DNA-binding protein [Prevotella sp.]|nr:HU family DNA-binding protein [Prevotella sp.]